jgi:hypothetical protein
MKYGSGSIRDGCDVFEGYLAFNILTREDGLLQPLYENPDI